MNIGQLKVEQHEVGLVVTCEVETKLAKLSGDERDVAVGEGIVQPLLYGQEGWTVSSMWRTVIACGPERGGGVRAGCGLRAGL